jgi:cytochrome c peroxidase
VLALLVLASGTSCRKHEVPPPAATSATPVTPASVSDHFPAPSASVSDPPASLDPKKLAAYAPLPGAPDWRSSESSKSRVELGRALFHDKRLSSTHDSSCSKCHLLSTFGTDGKAFSIGHAGKPTHRNTPSIYGAALLPRLFWDGRAETLEAAIQLNLSDPALMGAPGDARLEATLRSIPAYALQFASAFPDEEQPVTAVNAVNALGAFSRILVAPARWDRFLQGEESALTIGQKIGFHLFVETGCSECHAGALVGGDSMRLLGKARPWPNQSDKGKGQITHAASDDMMFRVPSLRNVSRTGPYFHDASAKTLGEAVRMMAAHQLGKDLDDETVRSITGWLETLSADASLLEGAPPELPQSTLATPKPMPLQVAK